MSFLGLYKKSVQHKSKVDEMFSEIIKDNIDKVKEIINEGIGVDIDSTAPGGITTVSVAVQNGSTECLDMLLSEGANPHVADDDDNTPIFFASYLGHIECLKKLIDVNCDVNYKNKNTGVTPLMVASAQGHYDCVKLLIENKADSKAQDNSWSTALIEAVKNKNIHCAHLLIDEGIDDEGNMYHRDKDGMTAFDYNKKTTTIESYSTVFNIWGVIVAFYSDLFGFLYSIFRV